VCITESKGNLDTRFPRTPIGHRQHFFRRVDPGHARSATCQGNRRTAGSGSYIEHRPLLDGIEKPGDHLFLSAGNELPNRTTEAKPVERLRHSGIGVNAIAVMV
jgi:hypothetical protein